MSNGKNIQDDNWVNFKLYRILIDSEQKEHQFCKE